MLWLLLDIRWWAGSNETIWLLELTCEYRSVTFSYR